MAASKNVLLNLVACCHWESAGWTSHLPARTDRRLFGTWTTSLHRHLSPHKSSGVLSAW